MRFLAVALRALGFLFLFGGVAVVADMVLGEMGIAPFDGVTAGGFVGLVVSAVLVWLCHWGWSRIDLLVDLAGHDRAAPAQSSHLPPSATKPADSADGYVYFGGLSPLQKAACHRIQDQFATVERRAPVKQELHPFMERLRRLSDDELRVFVYNGDYRSL